MQINAALAKVQSGRFLFCIFGPVVYFSDHPVIISSCTLTRGLIYSTAQRHTCIHLAAVFDFLSAFSSYIMSTVPSSPTVYRFFSFIIPSVTTTTSVWTPCGDLISLLLSKDASRSQNLPVGSKRQRLCVIINHHLSWLNFLLCFCNHKTRPKCVQCTLCSSRCI